MPLILLAAILAGCAPRTPAVPSGPTETSATPAPPTATPEPMAAAVNDEGIPLAEWDAQVTEYIEAQEALGKSVTEAEAGTAVLEDMIAQVLLAQGARAEGFELTEEQLQQRIADLTEEVGGEDKLAEWQSTHGYTEATFRAALRRSAEAAFMRDKIVTAVPKTAEQVHVQQILLYNESDAIAISNQLKGGVAFDLMAGAVDPVTRGELSWFPRDYLLEPAVEEVAFILPIGQVSDIIHSGVGYHIIMVLEREEDHPLSPDAYLALQEKALEDWVAQKRAEANVVHAP